MLCVLTGMRKAEVCALRWSDISEKTGMLKGVEDIKGEITIGLKNGEFERVIGINAEARELIKTIPRSTEEDLKDYVVPCSYNAITLSWVRLKKRAGIKVRWHDSRHMACTYFVKNLDNLAEAMKLSGHKSIVSLLRYTHLEADSIIDKLDKKCNT